MLLISEAILELKKWGEYRRAKEKVGRPTQMSIMRGDFSLFWRSSCYD